MLPSVGSSDTAPELGSHLDSVRDDRSFRRQHAAPRMMTACKPQDKWVWRAASLYRKNKPEIQVFLFRGVVFTTATNAEVIYLLDLLRSRYMIPQRSFQKNGALKPQLEKRSSQVSISTGAICAYTLEIEHFRNNSIGEELQYNTSDFLEISMFNDYMYLSRGKTQDYGSEPSGCTHWL